MARRGVGAVVRLVARRAPTKQPPLSGLQSSPLFKARAPRYHASPQRLTLGSPALSARRCKEIARAPSPPRTKEEEEATHEQAAGQP